MRSPPKAFAWRSPSRCSRRRVPPDWSRATRSCRPSFVTGGRSRSTTVRSWSFTPPPSRVRERKRSRRWPASSWVRNDSTVGGTRWTGSRSSANVVLHEFAHQLDAEDGFSDGAPILPPNALDTWGGVLSEEYERLRGDAEHDRQSALDEYGATNTAECFAVATESFFEKPV